MPDTIDAHMGEWASANVQLPIPERLLPPYERLFFMKHTTTISPQILIELIYGLTRHQEFIKNTTNLKENLRKKFPEHIKKG